MSSSAELRRDWYFTPGAEWIFWDDPRTGKLEAFRVILSETARFLEWSEENGIITGSADEGERPGRSKMAPVLNARPGTEREVAALVLELITQVRTHPPRLLGAVIELPEAALLAMDDVLRHYLRRVTGP